VEGLALIGRGRDGEGVKKVDKKSRLGRKGGSECETKVELSKNQLMAGGFNARLMWEELGNMREEKSEGNYGMEVRGKAWRDGRQIEGTGFSVCKEKRQHLRKST